MGRLNLRELEGQEFQVASLVADGATNLEVASKLGLPLSTVKNRLATIYKQLNISSRADLIVGVWGPEGKPPKYENVFVDGLIQLPKGVRNV